MKFSKVIIIAPSFEQRISKMAYSLIQMGLKCEVLAEEAQVADEFKNYIQDVPFGVIPCSDRLKRTPLGAKRKQFISEKIKSVANKEEGVLVIARDVNYGNIVTGITKRLKYNNVIVVTDVADNYDLLYASYSNFVKRLAFRFGFRYLTSTAFKRSDALIIVTPVNYDRIRKAYPRTKDKPILVVRNLPLKYEFHINQKKIPNSLVYVGKIDEISRDPMYILEKLTSLEDYTLHFYSSQKEQTFRKIRDYAETNGMGDRVIFHDRVPYDQLATEISKYMFGLVPHKRSPITDYTVPNKLYDYKSSGIVTIMSDCPSLIDENNRFGFGVVYSNDKDDFYEVVKNAEEYSLDFSIHMPTWADEFKEMITFFSGYSGKKI